MSLLQKTHHSLGSSYLPDENFDVTQTTREHQGDRCDVMCFDISMMTSGGYQQYITPISRVCSDITLLTFGDITKTSKKWHQQHDIYEMYY